MISFKNTILSQRFGWVWPVLLIGYILLAFSLELTFVLPHAGLADIEASVPDEAVFIAEAKNGFAHYGYGYGPVYWGILSLLLKLSPAELSGLIARTVFVLFKYAAFGVAAATLWRQRKKAASTMLLLALFGSPGFLFLGKIISPEYLLLFWVAICVDQLIADRAEFGNGYLRAVVFACLAVLTKLNALPLLAICIGYGFLGSLYLAREKGGRWALRRIVPIFWLLTTICISVVAITWGRNLFDDIRLALTLVQPLEWSLEPVELAWYFDGVTWDQIKLGGIQKDFLPVFMLGVAGVVFVNKVSKPVFILFFSAVAILISTVFHNMWHTWYLFLPMFLFAVFGAHASTQSRTYLQTIVFLLVISAVGVSWNRMEERIVFKLTNNHELMMATAEAANLVATLESEYPCIKSANFDILVSFKNNHTNYLPLRTALENWNKKSYVSPDILIVNRHLEAEGKSPLLKLVVKENIDAYSEAAISEHIRLLIKKGLTCGVVIIESEKRKS